MGTPADPHPSHLLTPLTTHRAFIQTLSSPENGLWKIEINLSASTCCSNTCVYPLSLHGDLRLVFLLCLPGGPGSEQRCKPEELAISAGAWGLGPLSDAARGHIITSTYTLRPSFMGFHCPFDCNNLIFSMMLLHRLMMAKNSPGLASPSLLGRNSKWVT